MSLQRAIAKLCRLSPAQQVWVGPSA